MQKNGIFSQEENHTLFTMQHYSRCFLFGTVIPCSAMNNLYSHNSLLMTDMVSLSNHFPDILCHHNIRTIFSVNLSYLSKIAAS